MAGAVPAKVILPALGASLAVSYVFWDLTRNRKIFGGTVPRTLSKEWQEATLKKFDQGWEREAGPPVVMNPIRRQNFRYLSDG